jgi:hypothetical protein
VWGRAGWAAMAGVPVVILAALVLHAGSVSALVDDARAQFATTTHDQLGARTASELNPRLFYLSANHRNALWRVAWRGFERHPLLGSGAGTFERGWLHDRPVGRKVKDAHSLWLERLYELGILGGGLAGAAFVPALLAGIRWRRTPHIPTAFAAMVALLVHQSVDWDWEIPAVTLPLVSLSIGVLVAARGRGRSLRPGWAARIAALGVIVLVAVLCAVALRVNQSVDRSEVALAAGNPRTAAVAAAQATGRAPWLAETWKARGEADLGVRRYRAAAHDFRQALARDDGDWESWYGLARALPRERRADALAQARRLNPLEPLLALFPG